MKATTESLNLHSIYRATEGEGVFVGIPQIFVRFQGCAVGCINCDSKETWDFEENRLFPIENVLAKISLLGGDEVKRVSITGGDPLHPKNADHVSLLAKELKQRGYWVNIEAAGTRVLPELFKTVDFISFDIKTPSTGVRTNWDLIQKFMRDFSHKSQIKAVVENKKDFDYLMEWRKSLQQTMDPTFLSQVQFVITPAYNETEPFPQNRFQSILEWNETNGCLFRVIGQQHKWIFGTSRLDV